MRKNYHLIILLLFCLLLFLTFGCVSDDGRGGRIENQVNKPAVETPTIAPSEPSTNIVKRDPDSYSPGQMIDQYRGIPIYYNGDPFQSQGRHVSPGGYNYGMKWQCVEFVKRYYYDYLKHQMPDTYGHAKDFFMPWLKDGQLNTQRDLYQFKNGGVFKPRVDDIVVYVGDEYGHIAIITEVGEDYINVAQQNVGTATRHTIPLVYNKNHYYMMNKNIIGYLGRRGY